MRTLHNFADNRVGALVGLTRLVADEFVARVVSSVKARNDMALQDYNFDYVATQHIVNGDLRICHNDSPGYSIEEYSYSGGADAPPIHGELITFYLKCNLGTDKNVTYFLSSLEHYSEVK
jgi:hypothetical protein